MLNMKHAAGAALIGLSQAALAQSVTIYGLVDLGLAKSNGGTATTNGGPVGDKSWQVQQAAVSRLGFRGSEDLGDGLSAQFSLETRFSPDTGAQRSANTFWTGNSYVQLTRAGIGSIWLGRNYIPAFYVAVKTDPFGWDGVGQLSLQQFGLYRAKEGPQASNIVGFKSARMFGGLTVDPIISFGEGTGAREMGVNVQYAAGNWYAGLGYDTLKGGPIATDGDSLLNFGLSYNFGLIQPRLYLARSKTGGGSKTANTMVLGATAPAGDVGRLKMAYLKLDPAGPNNTQQKFSLGYEYFLSKLTNLYFDGAIAKEQGRTDNRLLSVGIKKVF